MVTISFAPTSTIVTTERPTAQVKPALPSPAPSTGRSPISRVLEAAVVSRRFRQLLLTDPTTAVRTGYQGETFQLTAAEMDRLASTPAATLSEFAAGLSMAVPSCDSERAGSL